MVAAAAAAKSKFKKPSEQSGGFFVQKNRLLKSLCWRRPTLPGPRSPSTIGAEVLNFSVRKGKRCTHFAITTNTQTLKNGYVSILITNERIKTNIPII